MNTFLKQRYGLLMLGCIAMAIGLTYWFGIRVFLDNIVSERNAIQKAEVMREHRLQELGKADEYTMQYERAQRDEEKLNIFTEKDHMIDFVKRLESLADEEHVGITIEARDAGAVSQKSVKPKSDTSADSGSGSDSKPKDTSILGNLPSTNFTRLGLRITGETAHVIAFLQKVETLPVALDVISIDALRKEQTKLEEPSTLSVLPSGESLSNPDGSVLVPPQETSQTNPFTEQVASTERVAESRQPFSLEMLAEIVVYHPKQK